jgi:hypothetical protein
MIVNGKDLGEEVLGALGGALLIGAAFWFRSEIEVHVGQTATSWILDSLLLLYVLAVIRTIGGWVDSVFHLPSGA